MLHRWGFLLLFFIAIFTGDAIAGAYYEESYQEYRPRRSYRKSYSSQPRYINYSKRNYQNRSYKKRSRRTYRPISSYKTNFLPERIYIGTSLGHTVPLGFESNDESLSKSPGAPVFSLLTGADIYDWLRLGIEASYLKKYRVKGSSGSSINAQIQSTSFMINSYLTLPQYAIKPYVLLGIGISRNSLLNYQKTGLSQTFPDKTTNAVSYQTGGGISFPYKNVVFDGEAKYVNKGKAETKSSTVSSSSAKSVKLEDFVLSVSVRYYFNDLTS